MPAYSQLRMLSGSGIRLKDLPQAQAYLEQAALAAEEPSAGTDLDLWFNSQDQPDPLPLLCLRCRLSNPLHQWIQGMQRQHGQQHPLEPAAMAAYLLDDDGSLQLSLEKQRQPFTYAVIAASTAPNLHPFTAEVLRSWDPKRASLSHWGRERARSHVPLKAYFRECGLLLISEWALLADTSPTRVRGVWMSFGTAGFSAEQAVALHARYLPLYREAKLQYRQSRGKASGWEPDDAFLQQLAPDQSTRATQSQLEAIAKAIRQLQSGNWQTGSGDDLEQASDTEQIKAINSRIEDDNDLDGDGISAEAIQQLIAAALQRAMDRLLPPELTKEQKRFPAAPERKLAWQLYGEGLSQREIAVRCDHLQGWVSKLLEEKRRSSQIATAAQVELIGHPVFKAYAGKPEAAVRLQEYLRNHLLEPEQQGGVAPLRLWFQRALHTP
jgi:hypothetical protein